MSKMMENKTQRYIQYTYNVQEYDIFNFVLRFVILKTKYVYEKLYALEEH